MDHKCTMILRSLVKYLGKKFRKSTVVLLRGANPYNDLVRMSYSKQTFCSVSTFCFYPALLQLHQVYFPVTKLIADEHMYRYHDNFNWLTNPNHTVIPGVRVRATASVEAILNLFVKNITSEL